MDDAIPYGKITKVGDIGRVVRAVRGAADATQRDAAGLAGVGVRFLSEVERGKATAEIGRVLHLLDRMGVEVWLAPRGWRPKP